MNFTASTAMRAITSPRSNTSWRGWISIRNSRPGRSTLLNGYTAASSQILQLLVYAAGPLDLNQLYGLGGAQTEMHDTIAGAGIAYRRGCMVPLVQSGIRRHVNAGADSIAVAAMADK